MARPTITYNATPGIASGVDGTSFTSGSPVTPTANVLCLVIATVQRGTGTADDFTVAHSGSLSSLTATSLNNVFGQGSVANGARLKAFYGYAGSSPTSGAFTVTCTNTHTGCILQYFEIASPHLTTPEKQNAVTNEALDTTSTLTATLGSAVTANSLVVGVFSNDNGSGATLTGPAASDWGSPIADTNHSSPTQRQAVWFCTTEQQSFDASTNSAGDCCSGIMEFQQAAATGGSGNKLFGPFGGKLRGKV